MTTTPETPELLVHEVLNGYGMLDGTRAHAAQTIVDRLRAAGLLVSAPTGDEREAKRVALETWQAENEIRQYSEFYMSFEDGFDAGYRAARLVKAGIEAERDRWQILCGKGVEKQMALRAERDAALAAIGRVLAIHQPVDIEPSSTICRECSFQLPNGAFFGKVTEWPCPTVAALDGESEPEEKR